MSVYFKMMPEIDITPLLNQIRVPVLALAGDRDGIVPPRQALLIAENVQQGSLAYLPGAGHTPHLERSVEYARSLTEWLAKTDEQD
jgi:3-oxoadipate enol-lactonase